MAKPINQLIFVGGKDATVSAIAAAFARARGRADVVVHYAGISSGRVSPLAWRVLSEFRVVPEERDGGIPSQMGNTVFDVAVSLCNAADGPCAVLPGNPLQLHWTLDDFSDRAEDQAAVLDSLRRWCETIRRLVDDFYERGYLDAFLQSKRTGDQVLESMSDGVIAHDLNRRVFYFNAAAEKITGYSRESLLNRDCHKVIPGGLCGAKCLFCNGGEPPKDALNKEVEIVTASGEHRRISMTVNSMADLAGKNVGVLACFRDVTRELQLARRLGVIEQFAGIVGRDPKMLALYDLIPELAESSASVLIQGESGTGKELVAAALHNEGPRAGKMFVPVNCGALPEGLLESELFGHVKGAFTGAIRDKKGRFELADGGTIFLDEIGDISPAMQVKLLRVLQEGSFERVGGEQTIKVNVRVVSATHRNLQKEMAAGKFREDLFYRLSVVPLVVPPLRERRLDIPLLANHFLKQLAVGKTISFSPDAIDFMLDYNWPGNVRELQNWIQFALIKCKGGVIQRDHLPPIALNPMALAKTPPPPERPAPPPMRGRQRLTRESIEAAILQAGGNKVEAAKLLGVSRATLYRFLDENG
ncbi:MAG: sigma 54-interacting transcriptional regulator [bacterium]